MLSELISIVLIFYKIFNSNLIPRGPGYIVILIILEQLYNYEKSLQHRLHRSLDCNIQLYIFLRILLHFPTFVIFVDFQPSLQKPSAQQVYLQQVSLISSCYTMIFKPQWTKRLMLFIVILELLSYLFLLRK